MKPIKDYLGDSVYAEAIKDFGQVGVILTTENGLPTDPSNKIYLEPEVLDALNRFRERAQQIKDDEEHTRNTSSG